MNSRWNAITWKLDSTCVSHNGCTMYSSKNVVQVFDDQIYILYVHFQTCHRDVKFNIWIIVIKIWRNKRIVNYIYYQPHQWSFGWCNTFSRFLEFIKSWCCTTPLKSTTLLINNMTKSDEFEHSFDRSTYNMGWKRMKEKGKSKCCLPSNLNHIAVGSPNQRLNFISYVHSTVAEAKLNLSNGKNMLWIAGEISS